MRFMLGVITTTNGNEDIMQSGRDGTNDKEGSTNNASESVRSGRFKKYVAPRTGGSILSLIEELVKVGQTMGYNMEGCMNNLTKIIESQGASVVHR